MTDIVDKDGLIDENEERQQTLQQQAARDRVDFVKILPFEAAEEIFSYLSARDLRACSSVSVQWHELTNSSLLWRAIAEQAHFRRLGAKNILNKQLLEKEHFTSVESNFLNHFKRFRVPSGCDRLSPMNDWKRIHCQTNFLLYNWERGSYAAHVVPFPKLSFHPRPRMNTTRVIYPSKLPKDTLYLPYQYRHDKMCSRFYILRLDDEPKVVYELDMGVVPIACVNRDCLVFVLRKKIEMLMFDADDEFKTVGELFTAADYGVQEDYDKRENYFLNMDNSVIVAGFKYTCIKVWCRTTLNLLKTFNLAYKGLYFSYLHFHNSTLYFSTWITQEHLRPEAELKIWELNEDKVHRIPMKREVTKVCSNEKYLLLVTKLNVNINVIEVRERGDFNMVTMAVEQDNSENWGIPTPVALLCGERVLYLEAMTIKVISLNLNAVFVVCKAFSVVQIEQVVGDLLMVRLRDRVEVWDLKKGMRLYTPVLECPMTYDVYCHDTRLVVVKPTNEVKVIGFW